MAAPTATPIRWPAPHSASDIWAPSPVAPPFGALK
jgi:hypothetical protein